MDKRVIVVWLVPVALILVGGPLVALPLVAIGLPFFRPRTLDHSLKISIARLPLLIVCLPFFLAGGFLLWKLVAGQASVEDNEHALFLGVFGGLYFVGGCVFIAGLVAWLGRHGRILRNVGIALLSLGNLLSASLAVFGLLLALVLLPGAVCEVRPKLRPALVSDQ